MNHPLDTFPIGVSVLGEQGKEETVTHSERTQGLLCIAPETTYSWVFTI